MNVYLDTEFTDLLRPRLISIGMVTEKGDELYLELAGWRAADCSEFTRDVVLPLLDGSRAVEPHEAAIELAKWLEGYGTPVTIRADSTVDLRLVAMLFAEPDARRPQCAARMATIALSPAGEVAREEGYRAGLRRHHALDDAKALRLGWQAAMEQSDRPRGVSEGGVTAADDVERGLWLDDVRPAPFGWTWVRSAPEAIAQLQAHRFACLSLDHDLGEDPALGSGYDVVAWIEEQVATTGYVPPARIEVHSSNPAGGERIHAAIASIGRFLRRRVNR